MNGNFKTVLLAGGLVLLVAIGVVTLVLDLRPGKKGVPGPGGLSQPLLSAPAPEELHPNLSAGQQALEAGNMDEARRLFTDVPEEHASYPVALHRLGVMLDNAGDMAGSEDA